MSALEAKVHGAYIFAAVVAWLFLSGPLLDWLGIAPTDVSVWAWVWSIFFGVLFFVPFYLAAEQTVKWIENRRRSTDGRRDVGSD